MEQGIIFVPNMDYLEYFGGEEIKNPSLGLYVRDRCIWGLHVLIPIRDLTDKIVGFTGWDSYNQFLMESGEQESGLPVYKVSGKYLFEKDRYFLTVPSVLKNNFHWGAIFITDGVFDSYALNYRDIPAIALLGSTVSKEVLYMLSWYSTVYVCADNDSAGNSLLSKLKRAHPNAYRVAQTKTKDIEALLREDGRYGPITQQLCGLLRDKPQCDYRIKA